MIYVLSICDLLDRCFWMGELYYVALFGVVCSVVFLFCVLFDVCACLCPKSDDVSFIVSVQVNGF